MAPENHNENLDANIDEFLAQEMPSLDPVPDGAFAPQPPNHPTINVHHLGGPSGADAASVMTPSHELSNTMETTLNLHDGSVKPLGPNSGPLGNRFLGKLDSDSFNTTISR